MFFYVVAIFRFFFLLMNGILILGLIILRIYNIIIYIWKYIFILSCNNNFDCCNNAKNGTCDG